MPMPMALWRLMILVTAAEVGPAFGAAASQPVATAPASQPGPPGSELSPIERLRQALEGRPGEHPLEGAARRMDEARQRLGRADAGLGTQEIQNQVVRDLQRVIALLEQMQSGASGSQPQRGRRSPDASPPPPSAGPQPAPAGRPGARPLDDSRPTHGQAVSPALRPLPSDADKWGFLPETLREEILQSFKEEFLPRFRQLLEAYYSTLSNPGQRESKR